MGNVIYLRDHRSDLIMRSDADAELASSLAAGEDAVGEAPASSMIMACRRLTHGARRMRAASLMLADAVAELHDLARSDAEATPLADRPG